MNRIKRAWVLVGTLLTDIDSLADVRDILDVGDLGGPPGLIYEAIVRLEDSGTPPSIDGVIRWIEAEHQWDERLAMLDGGVPALRPLLIKACSSPMPGSVRGLAAEIKQEVVQARLSTFLYFAHQQSMGRIGDLTEFFSTIETQMSELRPSGNAPAMSSLEASRRVLIRHEQDEQPKSIETGLLDFDRYLSLDPGRLMVIAARPGMGKSALALDIARRAAHYDQPVFVASAEMSPDECYARIIAAEGQLNSRCISKASTPDHLLPKLTKALKGIVELPLAISDVAGQSVFGVSSLIRRQARKGARLAIVDYLGLLSPAKGQPREQWALKGDNMRHLKLLAQRLAIPIIVLVQANQRVEHRGDQRVRLGDLHGSGEIAMHSDMVITLFREDVYQPELQGGICEVCIVKNRAGELGRLELRYQPEYNRFDNLSSMEIVR